MIDVDYAALLQFHIERGNSLTLVACSKNYVIPYGACQLDDEGDLEELVEKPEYNLLINAGLYVVNPEILEQIPSETFFHITQLMESVRKSGLRVGVYPIGEGSWIDVGQWPEYKKALEIFE